MVDALLTSSDTKTTSGLYRFLKGQPSLKNGADFLRESPWRPEDVGVPRKSWILMEFLKLTSQMKIEFLIFISIDDKLG